jgi:6-pyruvoyltetrahydropterin/6-carboxytetrahydropterin synthase
MTRRVAFSSGHRYWLPDRSPEENRALFGRWASPYNHGHNYALEVTVEGSVEVETGMVINIKRIDDLIKTRIVSRYDQKSLNDEADEFKRRSPSLENLMSEIALRLSDLPDQCRLVGIKLEETPLLYGEWNADSQPMISLTRVYEFAAAHRLHSPHLSDEENVALYGKCNNPRGHGHNYVLEVTVSGEPDPVTGMMVDIESLDAIVNEQVVDRYDHKNLNEDIPEFAGTPTTSEVVALAIFDRLESGLPAKLTRVRLFETARNVFEVTA